jgi:hypothetical protein
MVLQHVVVDGSNIATEGRDAPSLSQLDDAVQAFVREFEPAIVTVVVDATFPNRIARSERQTYEDAVVAGEIVTPPAGAVGRGDAFVLQIADRTGATVLSNDSFQEFHGSYDWLFDDSRLIGGKPVAHVGWVFMSRTPVRGPASRRAVNAAKRAQGATRKAPRAAPGRDAPAAAPAKAERSPKAAKTAKSPGAAETGQAARSPKAAKAAKAAKSPGAAGTGQAARSAKAARSPKAAEAGRAAETGKAAKGGRAAKGDAQETGRAARSARPPKAAKPAKAAQKTQGAQPAKAAAATKPQKAAKATKAANTQKAAKSPKATKSAPSGSAPKSAAAKNGPAGGDAVYNEALPFIEFVGAHPVGSRVDAVVEEFSSHGAYVQVDGVRAYVPLRYLGEPPPRSAKAVLRQGESREFVVVEIDAARRGVDLGLPDVVPASTTPKKAASNMAAALRRVLRRQLT